MVTSENAVDEGALLGGVIEPKPIKRTKLTIVASRLWGRPDVMEVMMRSKMSSVHARKDSPRASSLLHAYSLPQLQGRMIFCIVVIFYEVQYFKIT